MTIPEITDATTVVRAINEQRGCPLMLPEVDAIGSCPVNGMPADAHKQEYYFLLDEALPQIIEVVREFRDEFPEGITERHDGKVTSSLHNMEARVKPHVKAGDFFGATYWAHDAVYGTIDAATEEWLARTGTESPFYKRLNSLVDEPRQQAFGANAAQRRISSAANQTVLISCGFQRMTERLFPTVENRPITPDEMATVHGNNLELAVPLTRLHLQETRYMREEWGAEVLPGGRVEVYTNTDHFAYANYRLGFRGMLMARRMAESYPGAFPDRRLGCPGAEYIPEIWGWLGNVTAAHAYAALEPDTSK